ncbi:uncharacterized protein PHALS_14629 [Plasmopara halstedii]|uniref:Uncharacterized protein n=1 Tax=Plasmopara halstedii TaxID=4781 RepID=A0A0N7L5U7_PLAHL|nr:uncharacterized protein PHALS_14629 [Plasmopara halstedii]CEG42467.1 hypothetical protein PHALS_14629 [Plasmopara halstedii]|eukprot:XP_024578836.1 hypothetical protein PHALS_14629 [Plasmopara halstedii]
MTGSDLLYLEWTTTTCCDVKAYFHQNSGATWNLKEKVRKREDPPNVKRLTFSESCRKLQ